MTDKKTRTPDASGTVRDSKKVLREERAVRLTKALRDNLAKRKSQIRARTDASADPDVQKTDD